MCKAVNLVISNGNGDQTYDIVDISGVVRISLTKQNDDYMWTANVQSGSPLEL